MSGVETRSEKEGMMSDENVVSIGDWRINRKHASYSIFDKKECRHLNTTMMDEGQYIRCDDCNAPLSAYWVLSRLLQDIRNTRKEIRSEQQRLALAPERALRLKAAQTIEGAWRSRTMVPACPHCTRGIFAADMLNPSYVSKEIEMQRRKTEQPPRHSPLANIEILRAQEKILEENSFGRNPPDVAQEVTQGPKK